MILDDEPAMVDLISTICKDAGYETSPFRSPKQAMTKFEEVAPDVVLLDLRMGDVSGLDVLKECESKLANTPFIVVSGQGSVESAVEAMRLGAYDYICKPFKVDELRLTVKRALDHFAMRRENQSLRQELNDRYSFENIVGRSLAMEEIFGLVRKVSRTDSTVLIQGESGTGKELVARAIHYNSRRCNERFVPINCSALPENLLESELFGHKKGSFTGAVNEKIGLFEEAHEGTLFLDEINSMAQTLQVKLLRVLQEREIRRVGDNQAISVNVRVVAASNEKLETLMDEGNFREDLYYRLAVIPMDLPPLRERVDDIPLLARFFLQKHSRVTSPSNEETLTVDDEAMECLCAYSWPGNVRELENAIERACALCEGTVIEKKDLPRQVLRELGDDSILTGGGSGLNRRLLPMGGTLNNVVRDFEKLYIEETLKAHDGNREAAARSLQISLATLYRKLGTKGPVNSGSSSTIRRRETAPA